MTFLQWFIMWIGRRRDSFFIHQWVCCPSENFECFYHWDLSLHHIFIKLTAIENENRSSLIRNHKWKYTRCSLWVQEKTHFFNNLDILTNESRNASTSDSFRSLASVLHIYYHTHANNHLFDLNTTGNRFILLQWSFPCRSYFPQL